MDAFKVCGESSCKRGPVVIAIYVEVGVADEVAAREVVFEEI